MRLGPIIGPRIYAKYAGAWCGNSLRDGETALHGQQSLGTFIV